MTRQPVSVVVLAAVLGSVPAAAQESRPCGGWTWSPRSLVPAQPLDVAQAGQDSETACLKGLAGALKAREDLVSVTVEARLPEGAKTSFPSGLAWAQHAAQVLTEQGVEPSRVAAVLAPVGSGPDGLSLRTQVRPPVPVGHLAVVDALDGEVSLRREGAPARPAQEGTAVLDGDTLVAAPGTVVKAVLLGGSSAVVQGGQLGVRQAQGTVLLRLASGTALVQAGSNGVQLDAGQVTGRAGAGTFRWSQDGAETRLQALAGSVSLVTPTALEIPAGTGQVLKAGGTVPGRPLLPEARPQEPLQGTLAADGTLRWEAVPGAARYRVELARDAAMLRGRTVQETADTTLPAPAGLGTGRWFWRVTAVDETGVAGRPSRVFAIQR